MFASAVALSLAVTVSAATPTEVVKNGNAEIQKVLAGPDASADKLAQKADEFVDFEELAKRALGPTEWAKLTPEQQKDFSGTMKGLLRASYAQKAIGQGSAAKTEYGKETVAGDEASVNTTLVVKKDKFPVDYKLYKTAGAWKIFDVITDEVSLVETYRGQFRKLIADKGFNGLLETLKAKKSQLEKQTGVNNEATAAPSTTPDAGTKGSATKNGKAPMKGAKK